jgi:hypothetical protein
VGELFQSDKEEVSNENFLELEKELNDEDDESYDVEPLKHLSTKQLTECFKHINIAISIIDDNDANRERSAKVTRAIESAVVCYKEFYSERQKAASLHHFFRRAESCQSTGSAREPVQPDHASHSPAC